MGILKASDSGGDKNAEERPGEGSAVLNAEQARSALCPGVAQLT